MGLVLALPLAPRAAALVAEGRLPRGLAVAGALAWIAVALPAPFAGWAALAGAALIVAAVVAANAAAGPIPRPACRVIVLALSLACWPSPASASHAPPARRTSRAPPGPFAPLIWAFAILIVIEATLGACGRLDARSTLAALAAVALALASERAGARPGTPRAGARASR